MADGKMAKRFRTTVRFWGLQVVENEASGFGKIRFLSGNLMHRKPAEDAKVTLRNPVEKKKYLSAFIAVSRRS